MSAFSGKTEQAIRISAVAFFIAIWLAFAAPELSARPLHRKPSASWKGTSAGFSISMTPSRLLISSNTGTRVFDSSAIFLLSYKKMRMSPDCDCPGGVTLEQNYKLLSVVGPLVSIEYEYYIGRLNKEGNEIGAHPSMGRAFFVIDCRNPGNIVKRLAYEESRERSSFASCRLDKIFPLGQLRAALTKSFDVELEQTSKMNFNQFKDYVSHIKCDYVDPCTDFAFSKVVADSVIVNVGIGGPGASHATLQETPLTLAIPAKYKKEFELARSGRAGFLESNRPSVLRSLSTTLKRAR